MKLNETWDKKFPKSDKVDHQKVAFKNRYGITLIGDLYLPKNRDNQKLAAIILSGPFGAVKEQSSGLHAQTLAERGFVTLALTHHLLVKAVAKYEIPLHPILIPKILAQQLILSAYNLLLIAIKLVFWLFVVLLVWR